MNKGLEVIEAHHLFGLPYEQIGVVVHPESIVHALVHLNDGATLAHLGHPDMRVPISYALHYPERADVPGARRSTSRRSAASPSSRPTSRRSAASRSRATPRVAGGTAPCVLNAANEVAVHAFLAEALALPRHRARDRGHARGDRAGARRAASTTSTTPTRRRGARRRRSSRGWRCALELVPRVRGLLGADHPARARPLRRGEDGRHAGRAVLALLPAATWRASGAARPSTASAPIPLGGFVKITGMNPEEELPPDVAPRAYYHQPVWKRIVVIGAGPGGQPRDRVRAAVRPRVRRRRERSRSVADITPGSAAAEALQPGRPHHLRRRRAQRGPDRARAPDLEPQVRRASRARAAARRRPAVLRDRARRARRDRARAPALRRRARSAP